MKHIQYSKREMVERYVTALYERGAYNPDVPRENVCLACGFVIDADTVVNAYIQHAGQCKQIYLAGAMRFCPICGSRFDKESDFGLYPEEMNPEDEDDTQELKGLLISDESFGKLVGKELAERFGQDASAAELF